MEPDRGNQATNSPDMTNTLSIHLVHGKTDLGVSSPRKKTPTNGPLKTNPLHPASGSKEQENGKEGAVQNQVPISLPLLH